MLRCAVFVALAWALIACPKAQAQQDTPSDEPLTKEEFAKFLGEYQAFQAEYTKAREENQQLRSDLATVKTELSSLKENGWKVEFEQAIAQERQTLFNEVRQEIGDRTQSLIPGFNNVMVTGFAATNYQDRQNVNSTFGAMVAPIILWKPTDKLLFETEIAFMLGEEETDVELGYAQVSYLLNDYITLAGGKFLLPFGTFWERGHPPWINKLPTRPLTSQLQPESGTGFQVRGGAPIGSTKINYAAFIVNGPDFNSGLTDAGSLGFERNRDNNNSKAFGGRVGFLPVPELEVGMSLLRGRVGTSGSRLAKVDTLMLGADLSYSRQINAIKGRLDIRGEFVRVDTDDVVFTGPFNPFTFDNKRNGWYLQAAYRPTKMDVRFGDDLELKNFEFVVRYDQLRRPGSVGMLGMDKDQLTLGVDYWLRPNVVFKTAYVFDDTHGGRDQDGLFVQLGIGF